MKAIALSALLLCTPLLAQETERSTGNYGPPISQLEPGTPAWHADMVRLGHTRKVNPTNGAIYYSYIDQRNVVEKAEASRPAIPFPGQSSTSLVAITGWQSVPRSSSATEPSMSELLAKADQVLKTATLACSGDD